MIKPQNHFCCDAMCYAIEKEQLFKYAAINRGYYVQSQDGVIKMLSFCPWCGLQLPRNLINDWYDILENDYGVKALIDDAHKIPGEFNTDEWWKKRGL